MAVMIKQSVRCTTHTTHDAGCADRALCLLQRRLQYRRVEGGNAQTGPPREKGRWKPFAFLFSSSCATVQVLHVRTENVLSDGGRRNIHCTIANIEDPTIAHLNSICILER